MDTRFATFVTAVVARTTNTAQRRAIARGSSGASRATPTAFAVALLMGGGFGAARSAPPMCADVLKAIEKRLADAGVQHPPLKIVPKNPVDRTSGGRHLRGRHPAHRSQIAAS